MLYDKLKDLALEFGNAIVREALKEPLGQLEELMRDGALSTAPTSPPERAHVVSRPKEVFHGKRLIVPPTIAIPSSLAPTPPTVVRSSPKKKTGGSAVKKKPAKKKSVAKKEQKSVARPDKSVPKRPARTPKSKAAPAVAKTSAHPAVASDDVVLKHLPKGKPVRSDKLKAKTGLGTEAFAKRVDDLMRRGVVVRTKQGTHRYYGLV